MATSNIKLFDENKVNMMPDEAYQVETQRTNGVQSGIASSQLQNKTLYQVSLVSYAIAQIMNQNGLNANDSDAVSTFVNNLSSTMLQKVYDIATTAEAQAGVATGKWMSPALVKAGIDALAAKAQNILSNGMKTVYGLGPNAVPDDVFRVLSRFQSGLGNEYMWDKCTPNFAYTEKPITTGNQNSLVFTGSGSSATFRISNTLQDALIGVYTEQTITPANRTSLNGKYVRTDAVQYSNQPSAYEYIFYIALNATWSIYTNPNGYCFSNGTVYTDIKPAHIHQSYVNSADPDAYPVNDGYVYEFLGRLGDAFSGAKIATGSYKGTGTFGANNPNSLTFDFEPKMVLFTSMRNDSGTTHMPLFGSSEMRQGNFLIRFDLLSSDFVAGLGPICESSQFNDAYARREGNTVFWYIRSGSNSNQLNLSNYYYYWLAIG